MKAIHQREKIWFKETFEDYKNSIPSDVLSEMYFERLLQYKKILEHVNIISKSAQNKLLPTGSMVIGWTYNLINVTKPELTDSQCLQKFKEVLHETFQNRLGHYLKKVTVFLKAAMFDTREAGKLLSYGISEKLIKRATENILDEGFLLFKIPEKMENQYKKVLKQALTTVLEMIKISNLDDPFAFFRDKTHGGLDFDNLLSPAIMQVRPIAAMYLAFPAGTAASVRGFSGTTATVRKLRSSMSDELLESLTIIRDYLIQPSYTFDDVLMELQKIMDHHNK